MMPPLQLSASHQPLTSNVQAVEKNNNRIADNSCFVQIGYVNMSYT